MKKCESAREKLCAKKEKILVALPSMFGLLLTLNQSDVSAWLSSNIS
jgi:hypothetical protein